MKFISFNINGLRARPHQLEAIIEKYQPDVIGLQEIKVADEEFPHHLVENLGYHVFHHGQKGHYGVALLSKQAPLLVRKGFPTDDEEAQKRIIMIDLDTPFGQLTVINGYFPQGESREHPTKFPAKQKFYADLQRYLQAIDKRIDKLAQDVNRDRAAMLRVEQVQQAYQQLLAKLPKSKPISDEIAEIRYMIEELRVSLFAQQLGTKYQVSDKRILNLINDI